MALSDRLAEWFEDGETRGKALRWGWWISLAVLLLGYIVIFRTLV